MHWLRLGEGKHDQRRILPSGQWLSLWGYSERAGSPDCPAMTTCVGTDISRGGASRSGRLLR
ncbi:hypothetical protein ACFPRL_15515 [Pseudoclavibacter helvolus]